MPHVKPSSPNLAAQAAQQNNEHAKAVANYDGVHRGYHRESKLHHAAGVQAKESPKAEHEEGGGARAPAQERASRSDGERAEVEALFIPEGQVAREETADEERIEGVGLDDERRRRGRRDREEDSAEHGTDEAEEAARVFGTGGGKGKYFQDLPEDRLGDLSLLDPNEIKRQLGPSVRFAQHAMLLAQDRMKQGMPRAEAIQFLASLYLGVADRAYAHKALKAFGPATGIIDLYPLELMSHLLAHVPSFLSHVAAAKFLANAPKSGYLGETGKPIALAFDPGLRIRGFAIQGGVKPGYVFEPVDPPGTYHLTFNQPGRFVVLISALRRDAALLIEEIEVTIRASDAADIERHATLERARASLEDVEPGSAPAASDPQAEPPSKPKKSDDLKIAFKRRI